MTTPTMSSLTPKSFLSLVALVALAALLAAAVAADFLETTTGTGLAFVSDPSASPPTLVDIPRLIGDGQRLDGEYLSISSRVFNPDGLPTASSGNAGEFIFEPIADLDLRCDNDPNNCSQFDNVNAYVHLDRFASDFWVDRLGMDVDFRAGVVTHSAADSWSRDSVITLGSGGLFLRNNALEDDIILHEYTHLILGKAGFVVDTTTAVEKRALGEGYADYFTLSYLGHPEFARWATRCPPRYECDGPPDDTEIRTLATQPSVWNWNHGAPDGSLRYGVCTRKHLEDTKCKTSWMTFEDIYRWGMIWGSTLWDVRTALGASVSDRLILSSIVEKADAITTFEDAADAILFADLQLHEALHSATLSDIFTARGIPHTMTGIEGEGAFVSQGDFELAVYPNPSAGAFTATFDVKESAPTVLRLVDLVGREVYRHDAGPLVAGHHAINLTPPDLAAGLYVLRVEPGVEAGESSASTMVVRRRY